VTDDTTTTDDTTNTNNSNAEAAKYRRRLREVEAERDTLSSTLQAARRREVDRLSSATLADPDDLHVLGQVDVGELLDDDGHVDAGKVDVAVKALVAGRPRLARDDLGADFDGGARSSASRPSVDWSSILSGRTR